MSNRKFLKDGTRTLHESTEQLWSNDGRFQSEARYRAWLTAMHEAHDQIGRVAAHRIGDTRLIDTERQRLAALRADLGLSRSERGMRPVPSNGARSESWAWGALYVLNGSALGASFLLKSGGIGASWPRSYVEQMAQEARRGRLKAFFDRLETVRLNKSDALRGAHMAFPRTDTPA